MQHEDRFEGTYKPDKKLNSRLVGVLFSCREHFFDHFGNKQELESELQD